MHTQVHIKNKQSLNQSDQDALAFYHNNDNSLSMHNSGPANVTQQMRMHDGYQNDSFQTKKGRSQGSKKAELQIQTRSGYEQHVRQSSTRNSTNIDPRKLSIKSYPESTKYKT